MSRIGEAWRAANLRRGLERKHVMLLVLLGAASFFDGYDTAIKTLALTQIRDDFGLTKSAASLMFAVVYFGALPAMAVTRWADRLGRRRMLIWSVLGYTLFSGLTALAPTPGRTPCSRCASRCSWWPRPRSCGPWRPRSCRPGPGASASASSA